MATQQEIDEMCQYEGPERIRFEETMYSRYFIAHVGADMRSSEATLRKSELMARQPDGPDKGEYLDIHISAMWFGWWVRSRTNVERLQ